MIWFTADTHFGHSKILEYVKRPYATVEEMDEALIKNWNERVQPNDDVYHLGDFGLCASSKLRKIIDRLHGKIHLIRGNHESSAIGCKNRFVWIKDYYELRVPDLEGFQSKRTLILFHYPVRIWNAQHYGTFHLFGHVHGGLEDDTKALSLDVGVDCHGYAPISYTEVKNLMKEKDWTPPFRKERTGD